MWGLVGGKVENGEDKRQGALREIFEEIGVCFEPDDIEFLKKFHWNRPDLDITFEVFKIRINKGDIKIIIRDTEVDNYQWMKPGEAFRRKDLMEGLYPILENVYKDELGDKTTEEPISKK